MKSLKIVSTKKLQGSISLTEDGKHRHKRTEVNHEHPTKGKSSGHA